MCCNGEGGAADLVKGREIKIAQQREMAGIPLSLCVSMQSAETAAAPVLHLPQTCRVLIPKFRNI